MRWAMLLGAAAGWACADAPTRPATRVPPAGLEAAKFWDDLAATRWNERATALLQGLPSAAEGLPQIPAPPNGQAWASRMLTYLSLAQYRAALSASAAPAGPELPLVSAAVAGASYAVLQAFFGGEPGMRPELSAAVRDPILAYLARTFDAEARAPGFTEAGSRIGRAVAEAVVAQAKADGYFPGAALPARNMDPGYWVPGPLPTSPTVRSLYGVRPFFLGEGDLPSAPAPLAVGSDALRAAADEVYAIVTVLPLDVRAAQVAIARKWNKVAPDGPFTAGEWNLVADGLIEAHERTELEAARVLAYANAAAFDAQIDCFASKFKYWLPRPAQVNTDIAPLRAFTTPNHPSYPSGHSCISGAFGAMLSAEFPGDAGFLNAQVEEAGMSRIYAGIHYRFDIVAGRDVGGRAAAKARAGSLE